MGKYCVKKASGGQRAKALWNPLWGARTASDIGAIATVMGGCCGMKASLCLVAAPFELLYGDARTASAFGVRG